MVSFNLLPYREVERKRQRKILILSNVVIIFISLFFCKLLCQFYEEKVKLLKGHLQQLEKKNTENNHHSIDFNRVVTQFQQNTLDLFLALNHIKSHFSYLKINRKEDQIIIEGNADSFERIFALIYNLEASNFLREVQVKEIKEKALTLKFNLRAFQMSHLNA